MNLFPLFPRHWVKGQNCVHQHKLIKKAASVGDILKLPLNSERLKKLTESYIVSNQKIKLGFGNRKITYICKRGDQSYYRKFYAGITDGG
jgi:hypothetical protein